MAAKPTPGPWVVDFYADTGGFDVYTDNAQTAAICSRGPWRHRAAESEANARLIAAAPDLLDALEEARNGLLWYRGAFPIAASQADDEAMARIDTAIAKAVGEAP